MLSSNSCPSKSTSLLAFRRQSKVSLHTSCIINFQTLWQYFAEMHNTNETTAVLKLQTCYEGLEAHETRNLPSGSSGCSNGVQSDLAAPISPFVRFFTSSSTSWKIWKKRKKRRGVKTDDSRIKRFVETNINSTTNKKIGKITNDYKSNKNEYRLSNQT